MSCSDNVIKKLTQLAVKEPYEVSLVPLGANEKKQFLITKNGVSKMDELLKQILKGNLTNEKQLKEIAKSMKLDDKGEAVLTAIMKLANTDSLGMDKLTQVVKTLSGVKSEQEIREELTVEIKKQLENEQPPKEGEEMPIPVMKNDGTFDLSKIEKSGNDVMVAILKSHNDLAKQNKSLADDLKNQKDTMLLKEYTAKAESLGKTGDEAVAFAKVMKSVGDANPEALEAMIAELSVKETQVQKSNLFAEAGFNGSNFGASALTKIEKGAESLRREKPDMTEEEAFDLFVKSNPSLYKEYLKEKHEQSKDLY